MATMNYALQQRVIDGTGKILDTTPGTPDVGSYVTEDQLKAWIKEGICNSGYYYNGNFYKESTHVTVIPKTDGALYVDMTNSNKSLYTCISSTYYSLTEEAQVQQVITNLQNGTLVPLKAVQDQNGAVIDTTYAKKADYVPKTDIVDNLTTQDATKPLSANQGYVLDGKISDVKNACDFWQTERNFYKKNGSTIPFLVDALGEWRNASGPSVSSAIFYVRKYSQYIDVTANSNKPATISFIKERIFTATDHDSVNFSTGETGRYVLNAGESRRIKVPTVPDLEDIYLVVTVTLGDGSEAFPSDISQVYNLSKSPAINLSQYKITATQVNLNGTTGEEQAYEGNTDIYTFYRISTDYIPIEQNKKYYCYADVDFKVRLLFYDSQKTFASSYTSFIDECSFIANSDGYIRVCILHLSNHNDGTIGLIVPSDIKHISFAEELYDEAKVRKAQTYVPRKPIVSVLGDSISTFADVWTQDAHGKWAATGCHYTYVGNKVAYIKSPDSTSGVYDPNRTWWMQTINAINGVLGINDAWAGSSVAWDGITESYIDGANIHMASQTRINHLGENGTPDIILVFGGTNDILHDSPLGTFDYTSPQDYTDAQIASMPVNTFADAYKAMLTRIMKKYPYAMVYCILPYFLGDARYNPHDLDDLNEIIKEAADYFGATVIDARTCGLNMFNQASYLPDHIHLGGLGMDMLARTVTQCVKTKMENI